MLSFSGGARFFLYQSPTDLRKGFEGLSTAVESAFQGELTSGAYFIFFNKPRNRIKVLYWDMDGLAIWYKRLEKGTFSKRYMKEGKIERREFLMLLEGVTPKRFQKRFKIS